MADIIDFPGADERAAIEQSAKILANIGLEAEQEREGLQIAYRAFGGDLARTALEMAGDDPNVAWLILKQASRALEERELTEKADRILGPRHGPVAAA